MSLFCSKSGLVWLKFCSFCSIFLTHCYIVYHHASTVSSSRTCTPAIQVCYLLTYLSLIPISGCLSSVHFSIVKFSEIGNIWKQWLRDITWENGQASRQMHKNRQTDWQKTLTDKCSLFLRVKIRQLQFLLMISSNSTMYFLLQITDVPLTHPCFCQQDAMPVIEVPNRTSIIANTSLHRQVHQNQLSELSTYSNDSVRSKEPSKVRSLTTALAR